MDNKMHIAHMLRRKAIYYKNKEVFKKKVGNEYQSTSWNTFLANAECISKFLLCRDIKIGDNIGILSPNCPEWTTCDLSILSVGAVVVPLFHTATLSQLTYIATETELSTIFVGSPELLILAKQALENIDSIQCLVTFDCNEEHDDRIVSFESIVASDFNEQNLLFETRFSELDKEDIATIIYTSGTTGEPKGVMLSHGNMMHGFQNHVGRLEINEEDVSMCFLPLSHVFERSWNFLVLYSGASVVFVANPKKVMEEMPVARPTIMCVVPRFFEKVYEGIVAEKNTWGRVQQGVFNWAVSVGTKAIEYRKQNKNLPYTLAKKVEVAEKLVFSKIRKIFGGQIRYMPCSGSAMSSDLRRFFHGIGLFVNYGYGASETVATVSCMRHDFYDFENTGTVLPNVEVKIGEDGMILVKGKTVFKGYYKQPKETAKVLKDGWYYTGDQGRLLDDSTLLMLERMKDIMKTSTGKYISPQKIELLLSQHESVEQMCLIGDNRKYLSALVVPSFSKLNRIAEQHNLCKLKHIELLKHDDIVEHFGKELGKLQEQLPLHERVVKFTLLDQPFSIDNDMLTPSMKVRRKQVNIQYKEEIEAMYN